MSSSSLIPRISGWRGRLGDLLFARQKIILQVVIVLLVVLLTFTVSLVIGKGRERMGLILAALPFVVVGVMLLEKRMGLTPIILLIFAAFVPLYLPTGTSSVLVDSLVLSWVFCGLWFFQMITRKQSGMQKSPVNAPAIAFSVITVISLGWSNLFRDHNLTIFSSFFFVQVGATLVMVISPLVLLLVGNQVRDEKQMGWMILIIYLAQMGGVVNFLAGRVLLPVNSFGLTAMWMTVFSLAILLTLKHMPIAYKVFLAASLGAVLYVQFVLSLTWIAGWLPALVGVFVLLLFKSKRLLFLLATLLAAYVIANFSLFQANFMAESMESGGTRLVAWLVNWQFTRQHFLFGMGPAGYVVYYMSYVPTNAMATHSNYIDVIAQTGILGFTAYMLMFLLLGWRGWVVVQRLRGQGGLLEAVSLACLGGWAGCMVIMGFGDWLLPFVYTQSIAGYDYSVYSWIFLGLILALDFITASRKNAPTYESA